MQSITWHVYGFGINTDSIPPDLDRIKSAIKSLDNVRTTIYDLIESINPGTDDPEKILNEMDMEELENLYIDHNNYADGDLVSIFIADCLVEENNIPAVPCKDYNNDEYYVVMPPCYPWDIMNDTALKNIKDENILKSLFQKYVSMISDISINDLEWGEQDIEGWAE